MNNREDIKEALKTVYGEFTTYLECEYENVITDKIFLGDINEKRKWMTFNQVVLEIKNNIKDDTKVKELQYVLTEDTNQKESCLRIINNIKNKTPELERLYNKLNNLR